MAYSNKEFILRNMRNVIDSPVPPSRQDLDDRHSPIEHLGLSPMSGLALDFNSASLNVTSPRRRLSLSSVTTSTPSPLNLHRKLLKDLNNSAAGSDISMSESPIVFKQSARISSTTMASPSRSRHVTDKENSSSPHLSPKRQNSKLCLSPTHSNSRRTPLEEHCDANSQDSGLELSADPATFRFAEPLSVAPRKTTPRKEMAPQSLSPVSPRAARGGTALFHCLSSGSESIDDGFLEFLSMDKEDDVANFPTGMGSLLSGKIMRDSPAKTKTGSGSKQTSAKRSLHRSLSMADCDTPVTTKSRSCLFKSPSADNMEVPHVPLLGGGFKRPEPPTSLDSLCSPHQPAKRKKSCHTSPNSGAGGMISIRSLSETAVTTTLPRGTLTQSSLLNYGFQRKPATSSASSKFQRSFSESEATIKNALQRSLTEPDLIGDFSRPFVLPLMDGRHADLKTISTDTLANLVNGHYNEYVSSYSIIDCRYPYEFNGGHIRGSRNLFTKDLVNDELVNNTQPPRQKNQRHVLVFHCEFSSERAPSMSRYLRNIDRDVNKECYPQLHYPEMYLLHGGYKAFYEQYSQLCDPCGYVPMLNQGNEADLRHFRAKSRSWAGDIKNTASRLPPKFTLKRLDV